MGAGEQQKPWAFKPTTSPSKVSFLASISFGAERSVPVTAILERLRAKLDGLELKLP